MLKKIQPYLISDHWKLKDAKFIPFKYYKVIINVNQLIIRFFEN